MYNLYSFIGVLVCSVLLLFSILPFGFQSYEKVTLHDRKLL